MSTKKKFLSTLSLRRATSASDITCAFGKDFYPRSPCGERQDNGACATDPKGISIHALLAESDHTPRSASPWQVISIHALLAESDEQWHHDDLRCDISIHALLAESDDMSSAYPAVQCISIHALLAESDRTRHRQNVWSIISIHALLAESDKAMYTIWVCMSRFLSTLSLRRATCRQILVTLRYSISIHALLAESDYFHYL